MSETGAARCQVLGTLVSPLTFEAAQDRLRELVERRQGAYVSCANAYAVSLARRDPELQQMINGADIVTADGMPIVWALHSFGAGGERVHNDDLLLACCARFPHWKVFLVGGREGQVELVARELRRRFPSLSVVGMCATPVRPVPDDDNRAILDAIERAQPDIVWAALGTPAQDRWMADNVHRVAAPMVGCGSLFDLLSGRTRPAPAWMKRHGLQWLFRLLQEPRRLLFRYAYHNTAFVLGLAAQHLRWRRARRARDMSTRR